MSAQYLLVTSSCEDNNNKSFDINSLDTWCNMVKIYKAIINGVSFRMVTYYSSSVE